MSGQSKSIKRFYQTVEIAKSDDGFEIRLDGNPLRTKRREVLLAPSAALAAAIKTEWDDQGEHIDPASTPLSSLLTEAIDADAAAQWRDDILSFLQTDLICYRADGPNALVERQAAAWDPYVAWLRDELGAVLVVTVGIVATAQADISIQRIKTELDKIPAVLLGALRKATAITGSAVMALALWKTAFPAADIYTASIVDDLYQAEKWGDDDEALARRDAMREEFLTISRFLDLLQAD